jgi:hypothetical protein
MATKDKNDPVGKQDRIENEHELKVNSPDRRRVLGAAAAAAAAAVGTVGHAPSPALGQTAFAAGKEFRRMPAAQDGSGNPVPLMNIDTVSVSNNPGNVRAVIRNAFQSISNADNKYLHTFRIVPRKTDDGCACGCS